MNVTRVVNLYKEKFDVYIGRAGKGQDGYFGNPFPLIDNDRVGCLEKFEKYFHDRIAKDDEFRRRISSLRGKVLGCFCSPKMCHGDVIVRWLEKEREEDTAGSGGGSGAGMRPAADPGP